MLEQLLPLPLGGFAADNDWPFPNAPLPSGTAASMGPAALFKGCPTLLLGALQLKQLRQWHSSLELAPVHGHGISPGISVLAWPERAISELSA
jgi:hypothetical protein